MIEKGFWTSLRNSAHRMKPTFLFRKVEDTYNAGLPDVAYRARSTAGFLELKYRKAWPKRDTTKVKFKATPNQMAALRDWYANGLGHAYGLIGVDRDYFLLTVPLLDHHELVFTQEEMRTLAPVQGRIGGDGWLDLLEWLAGNR